jgi:pimeloyl-ACP methyl ester carboxylesterase
MKPVVYVALLLMLSLQCGTAHADQLPRRGSLGAAVADQNGHVVVTAIAPSSAAADAGIKAGDAILRIDGISLTTFAQLIEHLRVAKNATVALVLSRNGTQSTIVVHLHPAAEESDPRVDTLYESVAVDGTLRRTLLTVPHGSSGRHPAVFFIGGIGCFSIDTTLPNEYRNLAHDLSSHGFVTLRLEKSGIGDSQGPPCNTVDFTAEAHSYDVALAAFVKDEHVDPNRVYIFGHSIGSVIAPQLAQRAQVAGLIVAEDVARNWLEYELINVRRQLPLSGTSPADVDARLRIKERCAHRFMVDKQSSASIIKAEPDCAASLQYPVPDAYIQQIADLNLAEPWMHVRTPVLVIYGASDFVVDPDDARRIVAIVNGQHAGLATLDTIADMDHYLDIASTQQESFNRVTAGKSGTYNPKLSEDVLSWLSAKG